MAKTMKAAQFHPDSMKISLETIPIPEPKDDEILVKTISSGLCHSDLVCT
jgi:D-arabinose 1-dehydrogenase-like Zn-dependent alcohol dehydrogenase